MLKYALIIYYQMLDVWSTFSLACHRIANIQLKRVEVLNGHCMWLDKDTFQVRCVVAGVVSQNTTILSTSSIFVTIPISEGNTSIRQDRGNRS